jgi:HAD superfamily hydrolase (TIGR01509 family)
MDPSVDLARIEVLFCDADGNLFDSEGPAFEASALVTNRFLASLGIARQLGSEELRTSSTGKNFRTTALELARTAEVAPAQEDHWSDSELERWVAEERQQVTAHLRDVLAPDPSVTAPLTELSRHYGLALVSSSALSRVAACLAATGLSELFPSELRFSAEDSLSAPRGKPDPAVYRFATERLEIDPGQGLAIEDSEFGVQAAVAAGLPTFGNLQFVPAEERPMRAEALTAAGALGVAASWSELVALLTPQA